MIERCAYGGMNQPVRQKKKWLKFGGWTALGAVFLFTSALIGKPSPDQPIAFSHKTHSETYKLACLYCHVYADRSTVAGVPPVQTCFGCHKIIAGEKPEAKKEIKKILNHWKNKDPIPWIRIYDLPDFVYFSHKRHVKEGVACQTCHGQIQEMNQVRRVASLEMGWCLNCHHQRGVDRDCVICHK